MRQINNGPFLADDSGAKMVGWTNPDKTETTIETGNFRYAFPFTSAGVQSAIDSISSSGTPGTVIFAGVDYAMTTPVVMKPGVSYRGIPPLITSTTDIPDSFLLANGGGTRFINSAGVYSFTYNNVDQAALPASNLAATALCGIKIYGLCSIGGAGLISTGAVNTMGLVDCAIDRLFYYDATDWGMRFANFQHLTIGDLRGRNQIKAGGIRYDCTLGSRAGSPGQPVLLPGNSLWNGRTFIYNSHKSARGIEFYCKTTTLDNQLNELTNRGVWQVNNFSGATVDMSLAFTNGSPDILVANQAHYDLLIEGGAFGFAATLPGAFNALDTYFVTSKNDANKTIRLHNFMTTISITPTSTGTHTVKYGGCPNISVNCDGASLITSSDLGFWDMESGGNIANLYSRAGRFSAHIGEVSGPQHKGALTLRSSILNITFENMLNLGISNVDSGTTITVVNKPAGVRYVTGNVTLVKTNHENVYIVDSPVDITFTVNTGMQTPDFRIKIRQVGAGKGRVAGTATILTANNATSGEGTEITLCSKPNTVDTYYVFGQAGP